MTARMLLVLFLSTPLLAQHQAITASAGERMRFTSPGTAAQIRVQILSIDGGVVFDSAWRDGNVFDWPAEGAVNTLVNGSYRCLVTVRDLDGKVTEKEATVTSRDGRLSMEGPSDASGAKVTLLAHDGSNGMIVSTAGDLSFRNGSPRSYPKRRSLPEYPTQWEKRKVLPGGEIKWKQAQIFISHALAGQTIGLEATDVDLWTVHFYRFQPGKLDQRDSRFI
jgi:hypothetical protein